MGGGKSRSRGRDQRGDRGDRGRDREDRGRGDRDRSRSRNRGRDRESGRDRRSDRPEKKKEVKDEFGRSKAVATDYSRNPDKYEEARRKAREERERKEREEPECDTNELKLFYLPFTKDWEQVMNRKFVSLRLEQDAWDLDAFDAKGDIFEMDDEDIQVTPDSFP